MARMAYLLDNFKDFGSKGLGWVVTGWSQYAQQSHAQQTRFCLQRRRPSPADMAALWGPGSTADTEECGAARTVARHAQFSLTCSGRPGVCVAELLISFRSLPYLDVACGES